jgi:hypothetical protein
VLALFAWFFRSHCCKRVKVSSGGRIEQLYNKMKSQEAIGVRQQSNRITSDKQKSPRVNKKVVLRLSLFASVFSLIFGGVSRAAEKLVGLQSAPSIAMALPWFAEEARLYSKYDLDFQLVYIASSGIVTAAMSSGSGSVAIVGGEGPIRAYLAGNTDFVFIGSGEERPNP